MGNYAVFRTPIFDAKVSLLSEERIEKIEDQLETNPYVGKPLGAKWFREKKLNGFRLYYLIYEDLKAVYIITLSGKKDQQKIINTIRHFLKKYREEIEDLTRNKDG
jgi:mRNA-degrading endonuclease RelE of RelBE toxin-antitoxin system